MVKDHIGIYTREKLFMKYYGLEGIWQADINDGRVYEMTLPGTLDENCIGHKDTGANQWHPDAELGNAQEGFDADAPIATRFTRHYTYEGVARLTKQVSFEAPAGKRIFLEAERTRCLRLLIDGREVPDYVEPTLSTPHVFEVTGLLGGEHEVTLLSDNSYQGLPYDAIVYSSAATDETQTNWNGVLGYLRLRVEEQIYIEAVRVYNTGALLSETQATAECADAEMITVCIELDAACDYSGMITVKSEALEASVSREIRIAPGRHEIVLEGLVLTKEIKRWDEYEGNLYELTVLLQDYESKTVTFGVRDFGDDGTGHLALNGRRIFLRSEANCAEFPETGHAPMTQKEWEDILLLYKSYGANCVRFHSHCPPKAAFAAADRIGMLLQPELSHWNPKDAFESEESFSYYRAELIQIIKEYANHPSFVMLALGNELWAKEKGKDRMTELLAIARNLDSTRIYANGSNAYYGSEGCDENSDFYTSMKYYEADMRGAFAGNEDGLPGHINSCYPSATVNYDATMELIRKEFHKPVFSFEVGQYEVLPDFDELECFQGISDPANLRIIQKRVQERGLTEVWKKYVEATGEISLIGYREEVEAVMRTEQMSGISLLGLQDFPGQGTALVGMLNSHLQPKPFSFAKPEAFQAFFRDTQILVYLPKYTWENTEVLRAEVKVANYGKSEIRGGLRYEVFAKKNKKISEPGQQQPATPLLSGVLPEQACPVGKLTGIGSLEIPLFAITHPTQLELKVSMGENSKGSEVCHTYPLWVYPPVEPVCPEGIYETAHFDETAKRVLTEGGTVYLTPPSTKEALPSSIKTQFTTDFWSVGTFPGQQGGMGQFIKEDHPLFLDFPTDFYSNWQWWPMATQRAVILPRLYEAIITEMDSYAFLRPMAKLFECRCMGGRLLFSSMGLQDLQQYPEARALLDSIYRYLVSEQFAPVQEIAPEEMAELVN